MRRDEEIAAAWWRDLQPYKNDRRNPTGDRAALARLRRADLVGAMAEPETFGLFRALGRTSERQLVDVSLCAAVLAMVREDERMHPARALGPAPGGNAATAVMSALRFRRLVEATTPEDRLIALRRAAMLAGRRLSVEGVARACLNWSEATRRTWIFQYYNAGDADPVVADERETTA